VPACRPPTLRPRAAAALLVVAAMVLGACSAGQGTNTDPDQIDSLTAPAPGVCRVLTPRDVAMRSNATSAVACEERHTAETYAVGDLPAEFATSGYEDSAISAWAFQTCSQRFQEFLGADESLVMRSVLSWAFFRPSAKAWDEGARWYRCDVVGGGEQSRSYVALPPTARGLMSVRPEKRDRWMVCVAGRSVNTSPKIPCTREHDWRAVTTIKLGEPATTYPGDRLVEVKTRDFCSKSVGGWLGYPEQYDYGYTWFHQAEWDAGNRRSICWAKTTQ